MTNKLANSENDIAKIDALLKHKIPSYRQAYSDRSAWISACLSELAYIRFNPLINDKNKALLLERVTDAINNNKKKDERKKKSIFTSIIESFSYDHEKEKKDLEETLETLSMELVKTFDENGTQAILALNRKTNMLVLAFRGTESNSIKDIKADADARITTCDSGGKIHSGFLNAYNQVALLIETELKKDEYSKLPLFITGHSLGGALATVAAKKLKHAAGISACYTFGSPRVGDEEWIEDIKTPIYRLVNAADCVTMLPPGDITITIAGWCLKSIPSIGKPIRKWLLSKLGGYLHCGNMRYLTNCQSGQFDEAKVLYSVSIFYRIKGLLIKGLPWKHFLADHSISIYRKKLAFVAERRNTTK